MGRAEPLRRLASARRRGAHHQRRRLLASSISSGVAGTPTKFLVGFDPKATPAAMVDAVREKLPVQTLAELRASSTALCDLVDGLSADAWLRWPSHPSAMSVSPQSPITRCGTCGCTSATSCSPSGSCRTEEDDEVLACLRNAAAINAGFALMTGVATPTTSFSRPPIPRLTSCSLSTRSCRRAPTRLARCRGARRSRRRSRRDAQHPCSVRSGGARRQTVVDLRPRGHLRGRLTSWEHPAVRRGAPSVLLQKPDDFGDALGANVRVGCFVASIHLR